MRSEIWSFAPAALADGWDVAAPESTRSALLITIMSEMLGAEVGKTRRGG